MEEKNKEFKLEFANRVIEHLGVKLYQNKPTNVVAEFVSNSWDADATKVRVDLKGSAAQGVGPSIVIMDNGLGMSRTQLTDEFLVIGRNRRKNPEDRTPGGRTPMGRKGIGKLAGFGIAKTIDVISCPNLKLRKQAGAPEIYWLRFSLADLIESADSIGGGVYQPEVIADGVGLDKFKAMVEAEQKKPLFDFFLKNIEAGEGGVCVHLRDTTLKRDLNPETMLKSMGTRFTIAMLHPDFDLRINDKEITPTDALPPFHELNDFGSVDAPIVEAITIAGKPREVRFWVRFVSLKDTDWSIESAGVGVYAHGKIAQDRPFFFGLKGKEILSRYMYGVVEADWLDELPDDVVSTDRRSIDWESDETKAFHEWGRVKMAQWVERFRQWKAEQPRTVALKKIQAVPNISLSSSEEGALASLLGEVFDSLGNDEEAKDKATLSFTEAWTHKPTRELTKSLWAQVFASKNEAGGVFADLVENLRKSIVPEAMGLAVTMAQRVAAITTMRKMIESDKTETHLQKLIEVFPWLLGPQWEHLTSNQTIRTLVTTKHKPDPEKGEWSLSSADAKLKPDFVFLADSAAPKKIVVIELKGPECGKTLQPDEYWQLREYLRILDGVYPDMDIEIEGILIGHAKGGFRESETRITVRTWNEVLVEARALHVAYLRALLEASEPNANDIRLQQIADFGGEETLELIKRLAEIGQFPSVIADALLVKADKSSLPVAEAQLSA
ncbi:ATP-binding protein [Burkholderia diffusa]|uniref:ATP-binding protein n=1 Tax=Burkholderia diffusa TaxID=488732 RepID=UPI0009BF0D1F|nr:ATP-binding protein [Burkholderia diffusa]